MQKLFFYFFSLFILFYACSEQGQQEHTNKLEAGQTVERGTTDKTPGILKQAPAEDLIYPEAFKDFGIPMYADAKITNNLMLENSKGKFGQRLILDCPGNLSEVFEYYNTELKKNRWEHDPSKDQEKSESDFEYRSVRYLKEGHLLMISFMDVKKGTVAVNQILKEM